MSDFILIAVGVGGFLAWFTAGFSMNYDRYLIGLIAMLISVVGLGARLLP
jgi:hypothetical protein